jgi:hypothetical protein
VFVAWADWLSCLSVSEAKKDFALSRGGSHVAAKLSLIPADIGKGYNRNWWIPTLRQMNIAIR